MKTTDTSVTPHKNTKTQRKYIQVFQNTENTGSHRKETIFKSISSQKHFLPFVFLFQYRCLFFNCCLCGNFSLYLLASTDGAAGASQGYLRRETTTAVQSQALQLLPCPQEAGIWWAAHQARGEAGQEQGQQLGVPWQQRYNPLQITGANFQREDDN